MKVFIATPRGQGEREGDFFHAEEGELLRFGWTCGTPIRCGCGRSLFGLRSNRATTTFEVVDLDIDVVEFADMLAESLVTSHWRDLRVNEALDEATKEAIELKRVAGQFHAGEVVRFNGRRFYSLVDTWEER
jgi:hypothetical protein